MCGAPPANTFCGFWQETEKACGLLAGELVWFVNSAVYFLFYVPCRVLKLSVNTKVRALERAITQFLCNIVRKFSLPLLPVHCLLHLVVLSENVPEALVEIFSFLMLSSCGVCFRRRAWEGREIRWSRTSWQNGCCKCSVCTAWNPAALGIHVVYFYGKSLPWPILLSGSSQIWFLKKGGSQSPKLQWLCKLFVLTLL